MAIEPVLNNAMIKVHLLCKRYYTNKDLLNDRFGRLYHLPVQLARLGATVSVTAIDYRNPQPATINSSGVIFSTAPATPAKLPSLVFAVYRTIRATQSDILIASGDSHIGYIGWRIARRLGIRYFFDVYDDYTVFSGNRIPGMKRMFYAAVKHADGVLCASEPLRHKLSKLNRHTLLIENGVDRTLFAPGDQSLARQTLGLEHTIPLVGYFGSITPTRGPLLVAACRKLRQAIPTLRLVLAGRVTGVAITEPWIDYLGELPQASVPNLILACDVVTVPYANDAFNSMAGPCKIAEYLACHRPVVATRISGHEQIFKTAPESLCEPDVESMASALRRQLQNPVLEPFPESMNWEFIGRELHESLSTMQAESTVPG